MALGPRAPQKPAPTCPSEATSDGSHCDTGIAEQNRSVQPTSLIFNIFLGFHLQHINPTAAEREALDLLPLLGLTCSSLAATEPPLEVVTAHTSHPREG